MQIITPFNVYFNAQLIFKKGEVWRLLTNFFFFGNLGELSNQLVHAHQHTLVQTKMPLHKSIMPTDASSSTCCSSTFSSTPVLAGVKHRQSAPSFQPLLTCRSLLSHLVGCPFLTGRGALSDVVTTNNRCLYGCVLLQDLILFFTCSSSSSTASH